ncbi:MAG: heparinase II/III family protein, partial [Pseudomonadota bacterium]
IEQKSGGNYLPENASWAKQTIAHNTLTINGASHFGGDYSIGSKHHSERYVFDNSKPGTQVVSAKERHAYPGTVLHRTMAVIEDATLSKPLVLDILKVSGAQPTTVLDLPFYFLGQVLDTNFSYEAADVLVPLGKDNGYQHLFLEASGVPESPSSQFTWMNARKFYTLTTASTSDDIFHFVRIGANDPDFNLRREPGFLIRRIAGPNSLFVNVIEPHGHYNPVTELATDARPGVVGLNVLYDDECHTVVGIDLNSGGRFMFAMANQDASASAQHMLEVSGDVLSWTGPFVLRPSGEP